MARLKPSTIYLEEFLSKLLVPQINVKKLILRLVARGLILLSTFFLFHPSQFPNLKLSSKVHHPDNDISGKIFSKTFVPCLG